MREVSKPIEEALNTVQGIKEITSTSLEGVSIVRLQFNLGVDVAVAQQDVQAKVARIRRSLPPDIDEPIIQHFDPNDSPIMSIALQSQRAPDPRDHRPRRRGRRDAHRGDPGRRRREHRRRQRRGRSACSSIRSRCAPTACRPRRSSQALQRENQEVPAGRVEQRRDIERLVRVTGRIVDPKAFADIAVAVRNGVADPHRRRRHASSTAPRTGAPRAEIDARPARSRIDVLKISGSNTVDVADSRARRRRRARAAAAERRHS